MWMDWDAIAAQPAVRRMAAVLRQDWGVWVGLLDAAGHATPLAGADVPIIRRACALLQANTLTGSEPGPASCKSAMRQWTELDTAREGAQPGACAASCHAKLGSLVYPLVVDGARVGSLYASGFLRAGSESRDIISLRGALRRTGMEDVDDAWIEQIPRLNAQDEQVLRRLLRALAIELEAQLAAYIATQHNQLADAQTYEMMLGKSPRMLQMFAFIERVARSRSTVLILGENGTGKELVARAVHQRSARAERVFLGQNCAAIPSDLIESELFGHKRGAFSGASRDRDGLFSAADHGTFFLDEIGEMELSMQAKLLRVLQEGTFLPVGDTAYRKVDVRVICATNRDLRGMVAAGTFREDLFYRVNVITIEVPPLRSRVEDLPLLIDHFLAHASREHGLPLKTLHEDTLDILKRHAWPGNVRELRHELERLVILSGAESILTPDMLSPRIRPQDTAPDVFALPAPGELTMPDAVDRLERAMIRDSLDRARGNKSRAARELGVSRRNLIRKIAAYGWETPEEEESAEEEGATEL
jgi:transcriptional regulator with PAS, ATPase and Fis domain